MKHTIENDFLTVQAGTFGGELNSIKSKDGLEYLWQADPAFWAGQAPVLFPIVGSLRNKTAHISKNKTCKMERHGVVRKREFQMVSSTKDSVTFAFRADEESFAQYPFDFELHTTYSLNKNAVETKFTVTNYSDEAMPFQIGGHPAFRCPLLNNERFEDYVVEFEKPETANCPTPVPATGLVDIDKKTRILTNETTLKLKHNFFSIDALIFENPNSRKAKLYNPSTGKGVVMHFSDFDNLLVWSSNNNAPFVALEPWSGLSTCSDEDDIFEHKRGVYILEPGKSKTIAFQVEIL